MSISLILLRFEIANNSPLYKEFEYTAPKYICEDGKSDQEHISSDWPALITDTLIAIHRGQRKLADLFISTLDEEYVKKAMADINKLEASQNEATERNSEAGSVCCSIEHCSKESTPVACSSKEGTPLSGDDVTGKKNKAVKDMISFVSGYPSVEVTKGILHIYKENTKTSLDDKEARSEMLCMLAVPTKMTVHDLLQFTAPCFSEIQHMRIIRNSNPNQYMVLVKFHNQGAADMFYITFNGQAYNTIEDDICNLVYVARVEMVKEMDGGGLPVTGHTELPTCPVCLERMDESVDGILTILCNHSFHGECLAKWGDTSCPVCRCSQTPEVTGEQKCLLCGATDSLWICLICGHVGCGRYVGGHAHRHFMETDHLFSLQLGNNRVWDYVRDNYVHRLLQSEGDGKVVSYEQCSVEPTEKEPQQEGEEKMTALQLEYTHLLSSQLESQRLYFEKCLGDAQAASVQRTEELQEARTKLIEELQNLKEENVVLQKDKNYHDRKVQQLATKIARLTKELETEQHLNLSLREGKKQREMIIQQLENSLKEKDEYFGSQSSG